MDFDGLYDTVVRIAMRVISVRIFEGDPLFVKWITIVYNVPTLRSLYRPITDD